MTSSTALPCPFLDHLSVSQLSQVFAYWSESYVNTLNPFWFGNQGQNIVGIFPKYAFYLFFNSQGSDGFVSIDIERKMLADGWFSKGLGGDGNSSDDDNYKGVNHTDGVNNKDGVKVSRCCLYSVDDFLDKVICYHKNQFDKVQATNTNQNINLFKNINLSSQNLNSPIYFNQGLMGFVSYDLMASVYMDMNKPDKITPEFSNNTQPTAYLADYDIYLTYQVSSGKHGRWYLHTTSKESQQKVDVILDWLRRLVQSHDSQKISQGNLPKLSFKPVWQYADYQQAFDKTQQYLYAGDCYQVNLTQVWQGQLANHVKLVDYLPLLSQKIPAPFSGYLKLLGDGFDFELLSCSPELFFTFQKNKNNQLILTTKPIKGTRPRGNTDDLDQQFKNELANSEKDQAENVMIVDLLRNDLGKYAKVGTVKVDKLFDIESFSNVHHMVSTISAEVKEGIHPLQVLFDSLPAGSITGTPKKRAIEIIHELETAQHGYSRGAYCGTMGFINFDGTGQWNVLIRTLQSNKDANKDGQVSLWAGGGITVASDCQAEYQECLDKVGNFLTILQLDSF